MNNKRCLSIVTAIALAVGIVLFLTVPARAQLDGCPEITNAVICPDLRDELLSLLDDIFDYVMELKAAVEEELSAHILDARGDVLVAIEVAHQAQEMIQTAEMQSAKTKVETFVSQAITDKELARSGIDDVIFIKQDLEDIIEEFINRIEEGIAAKEIENGFTGTLSQKLIDKAVGMILDLSYKDNLLLLIQFRIFKVNEHLSYAQSWLELANEVLCDPPHTVNGLPCLGEDPTKARDFLNKAADELNDAMRNLKRAQKLEDKIQENIKRGLHKALSDLRKLILAPPEIVIGGARIGAVTSPLPFSASFTANTARFVAEGAGISEIRVEVFGLNGARVYDSGFVTGNELAWHFKANSGEAIANGVYLYMVTAKTSSEAIRSKVQKLLVLR